MKQDIKCLTKSRKEVTLITLVFFYSWNVRDDICLYNRRHLPALPPPPPLLIQNSDLNRYRNSPHKLFNKKSTAAGTEGLDVLATANAWSLSGVKTCRNV